MARDFNAEAARLHLQSDLAAAREEIEAKAARDEIERLNNKFPCGHRKLDWDDSYGDCVVCNLKSIADDYERLPHEVIVCHDRIEELEAEKQAARETALREMEKFAETYPCHCASNYPGSTEYHGHDCQNAVVQEFVAQFAAKLEGK